MKFVDYRTEKYNALNPLCKIIVDYIHHNYPMPTKPHYWDDDASNLHVKYIMDMVSAICVDNDVKQDKKNPIYVNLFNRIWSAVESAHIKYNYDITPVRSHYEHLHLSMPSNQLPTKRQYEL